jgi:hypothetical protein
MNEMKQSINLKRVRFLEPYEEIVGTFDELSMAEGLLVARFKTMAIALPIDMEDRIRPFVGQKIGILRTDIPEKPYLFRLLDQETTVQKKATSSEGCKSI